MPYKHFIVKPFDREQINAFTERWYTAIADISGDSTIKENIERLINAIFENESVEKLATNSLLLK